MFTPKAKEVVKRRANNVVWLIASHRYRDDDGTSGVHIFAVGDGSQMNAINADTRECDRIHWSLTVARVLRRIVKKKSDRAQPHVEILVWELVGSELVHSLQVLNRR